MTPDQELVALRREVRELREELAEYRRGPDLGGADAERVALAMERLCVDGRYSRVAVKLILFLADRPGKVGRHEVCLRAIAAGDPDDCNGKYVHVAATLARGVLRRHGLKIELVWGVGYRMPAPDAAAVKRLIGEGGDD